MTEQQKRHLAREQKRKRVMRNRFFLAFAVIALFFAGFVFARSMNRLSITLNGPEKDTVECGSEYSDPGALAAKGKNDLSPDIWIEGTVDTSKPGDYTLSYHISDGKHEKSVERTVSVVDTTFPEIELEGDEEMTVYVGTEFEDPGARAYDIADGDITDRIAVISDVDTSTEGTYMVRYNVADRAGNAASAERTVEVVKRPAGSSTGGKSVYIGKSSTGYTIEQRDGVYYVGGILVANKTYDLPSSYGPGDLLSEFMTAFNQFKADGARRGYNYRIISGFRSYSYQSGLYQRYANRDGYAAADRYSARAGHSEHQSGLAADINSLEQSWGNTAEGKWLADNCYKYGFILRYPQGKESITGYMYESWHIRYVGVDVATRIYNGGDWLTLEEYLGITSEYGADPAVGR